MKHQLRFLLHFLVFLSLLSSSSLLLGGCGSLSSSLGSSATAAGTSCPLTYGAAGQHTCAMHSCAMHNPATAQNGHTQCQCDQHAAAETTTTGNARP